MPIAANGPLEIFYETFGNDDDPLIVLVPGLGSQLLSWPEEMCEGFVDRGFYVARMDNRDIGLSSVTDGSDYHLSDMAGDVLAVASACGHEEFHVAGMSMGGMIAQTAAAEYPARVRSLTSVMSSTGNPDSAQATPEAIEALRTPPVPGASVPERIAADISARKVWASPEWFDEELVQEFLQQVYDRWYDDGTGTARQYAAIVASGNRDQQVATIGCPTSVVHGTEDTLIPLSAGEHTAATIEGAELIVIDGMGHDMPKQVWAQIISAATSAAARAAG